MVYEILLEMSTKHVLWKPSLPPNGYHLYQRNLRHAHIERPLQSTKRRPTHRESIPSTSQFVLHALLKLLPCAHAYPLGRRPAPHTPLTPNSRTMHTSHTHSTILPRYLSTHWSRQSPCARLTHTPTPLQILSVHIVSITVQNARAIRRLAPQRPAFLCVLGLALHLHMSCVSLLRVQSAAYLFLVDHYDHDDAGLGVGAIQWCAVDPAGAAVAVGFWVDGVDGGVIVDRCVGFMTRSVGEPGYFCCDTDAL